LKGKHKSSLHREGLFMLYPVIIHKDEGTDYSVTVPDFPGVFSGGGTLEEALAHVQDAIEKMIRPWAPRTALRVLNSDVAGRRDGL
jgi:hypothetical protein